MDNSLLEENLTCRLCNDYFVDVVTLTECGHSFCRSCLLKNLRKETRCPTCFNDFDENMNDVFKSDQCLQNMVYKMVPGLFWKELKRIKRARPTKTEHQTIRKNNLLELATRICEPDEKISFVVEYIPLYKVLEKLEPKQLSPSEESLPTSQIHDESFKRYFRCLAKAKFQSIKKLLELKLVATESYSVHLLDNELRYVLEDELTLQDVVYLYHWDRQQPLQIYFTLIRSADEEDPPPVLDAEEMPTINTEQLGDTETKNSHLSNSEKCKSPSLQIPNLSIQLPPNSFNEGIINYPIITTVEVERTVSSDTRSPVPRKKRNTNSTRNVLKKTEQQSEELTLMSSTHINSDSVNASESKVAPLITTASELSSSTSRIRDSTTNSNGKQYQKLQKTDAAAAKSAQNNSPSRYQNFVSYPNSNTIGSNISSLPTISVGSVPSLLPNLPIQPPMPILPKTPQQHLQQHLLPMALPAGFIPSTSYFSGYDPISMAAANSQLQKMFMTFMAHQHQQQQQQQQQQFSFNQTNMVDRVGNPGGSGGHIGTSGNKSDSPKRRIRQRIQDDSARKRTTMQPTMVITNGYIKKSPHKNNTMIPLPVTSTQIQIPKFLNNKSQPRSFEVQRHQGHNPVKAVRDTMAAAEALRLLSKNS